MSPKERVLATLDRRPVDRVPVDLWHTPEVAASLRTHFAAPDDFAMWRRLGLDKIVWDFIDYRTGEGETAGSQSGAGAEAGGGRTTWGVPLRAVQSGQAHYMEFAGAPLATHETLASIDSYPWWPDADRFDYDAAHGLAERASQEFAVIGPWVSLFEVYCQLRGLDTALVDLIERPEYVDAVLDRIEHIQTEMMRRFLGRSARYLTLVFVSDDIAGQQNLLMSPAMWRRHLQPRLRRWCDLIHAHGLRVFYHTDGAARALIGPLIECGIDVLNPIQHVCPGMDAAELKREYGDRLIFHGGIDNQFALPRGTPDDVRRETRRCLAALSPDRAGYICCSCHNTQAGTPVENILAMVETVRSWSGPRPRMRRRRRRGSQAETHPRAMPSMRRGRSL